MAEIEDYAKYLLSEAESAIAVIHEFRILYAQDEKSFHVFLEGAEDRLYYLPMIRGAISRSIQVHSYVCNGKPKLADVRTEIYRLDFDPERCVFFADRDYDDFLNTQIQLDPRTYLTDFYSIENYIASEEAIDILLTDFGGMTRAARDYGLVMSAYGMASKQFAASMLTLSAWTLAMREKGAKTNLNNVNIDKVFEFSNTGGIKKSTGGFQYYKKAVGLPNDAPSLSSFRKWVRTLGTLSPKKWIRGKYELWFFRRYLVIALEARYDRRVSKWKIPAPLREDRLFETISGRIAAPESLALFLQAALPNNP